MKFEVKIINPDIPTKLPELANTDDFRDSAYDVFSAEEVFIDPGKFKKVSTNLAMHQTHLTLAGFDDEGNVVPIVFPIGLKVEQPSGLATKRQLKFKAGLCDSGYNGEIMIVLHNEGDTTQHILPREKIAQIVPHLVLTTEMEEVDQLSNEGSNRGANGWGSGRKS